MCKFAKVKKKIMKIIDIIKESKKPVFSFEILPPLKGNSIFKVYNIIDRLLKFDPKFVNITSHHSEYIYRPLPDGTHKRVSIVKRPGTVAVAAAIQNKYGLIPVPHIICTGFSKEETEYALIDLNFLGIDNLFLIRGDMTPGMSENIDPENHNLHALDLQHQINNFNRGIGINDIKIEGIETPFSYGMACYPEKHEEAPNKDSDLFYLKKKIEHGADYLISQIFFDNKKYFDFVDKCREEGITVPILPGIKPIARKEHLSLLPKTFRIDIPEELAAQVRDCKNNEEVRQVGIQWGIRQCKELIARGVPGIHFYTMSAADSVEKIANEVF